MLAQALIAEADAFVAQWKDLKLPDGRDRVVRHGHGPQRTIQTGVGPVEVRRAKVRDRGEAGAAEKIRFSSSILPKWARRTKSLDALLPVLYLRGVSTGDFQEALAALLGKDARNLSPAVIARLTAEWQADYDAWRRRDLSARRYVYVWADGVYLQARMEDAAECMLVLIGATPEGKKELVGFQTGVRESAQSWRELLIDIKQRGLEIAPDLAVGDGALGFWKAIEQVFPSTRHQRCWVHKTAADRPSCCRRAQGRSRLAASCAATARLGLDRPEHGGTLDRIGMGKTPMPYRAQRPMASLERNSTCDYRWRARATSCRSVVHRLQAPSDGLTLVLPT